ncbi:hypothetical protein HYALB_00009042 [Hymenoscyphus albidus]|uniref:Uncharacterized protein n=1 Tax=Hymenoscyphus albidus TaxID=595503 RepID=A0A9N9Q4J2_9HELO|nr:hypothetical protein HYALB_00009042 [Hymenoscyphus albidus]
MTIEFRRLDLYVVFRWAWSKSLDANLSRKCYSEVPWTKTRKATSVCMSRSRLIDGLLTTAGRCRSAPLKGKGWTHRVAGKPGRKWMAREVSVRIISEQMEQLYASLRRAWHLAPGTWTVALRDVIMIADYFRRE